MINPHFNQNRIIWEDQYSGEYKPVDYSVQFDDQWRLFLEKKVGFQQHTGVETADEWVDDRIFELTGVSGMLNTEKPGDYHSRSTGGLLQLEPKFPVTFFEKKRCLDVGCGAGRWTRALQVLGGQVKSIDTSKHGLDSVSKFNKDVEEINLFDILKKHPKLHNKFDFTLCWGVLMCTHDPKDAFHNVAATVAPGGHLYVMVYAPTYHLSEQVLKWRKYYHTELKSFDEKLAFAYSISEDPKNVINYLDMLNTYYNWVIREDTVLNWFRSAGFHHITTLNRKEKYNCAWHITGIRE